MMRSFGPRKSRRAFGLGLLFFDLLYKVFGKGADSPKARAFLCVMVILSLIFLAVPGIGVAFMFSGIGIPLAPAVILFPPIAFVWCCVLIFRRILPFQGYFGTLAAAIATGLLLFLAAQSMNVSAYTNATKVMADDHNSSVLPLQSETLAIVDRRPHSGAECRALCLHALLNGTASTVIVHTAPVGMSVPKAEEIATAYYFERRDVCPDVKLEPRHYAIERQGERRALGYTRPVQPNAAEIGAQRIASGNCLLSREAQVSEADLMIILGPVQKAEKGNNGFGFILPAPEIARLSVHKATGANTFAEVFRETSGTSTRFSAFLLPMASWEVDEPSGWLRTKLTLNNRDYSTQWKWDVFDVLEEVLDLKFTLDDSHYRTDAQENISAVLDAKRPPNPAEWQAFMLYWQDLTIRGTGTSSKGPNAKDAEIALRIVQSHQMPMPKFFSEFVRYAMMTNLLPADELGKALAARLKAGGTDEDMKWAALSMEKLPENVLRNHQDLLAELARSPDRRSSEGNLLHYLYLSGPDAAPILGALAQAGIKQDDSRLALQGLMGLCKIGLEARPYVENLDERQMSRGKGVAEKYFRRRISLSAAFDIEPEKVRRALPQSVLRAHDPEWFDKQYKHGRSSQWHCYKY